jgi:hypothetical protein
VLIPRHGLCILWRAEDRWAPLVLSLASRVSLASLHGEGKRRECPSAIRRLPEYVNREPDRAAWRSTCPRLCRRTQGHEYDLTSGQVGVRDLFATPNQRRNDVPIWFSVF